MKEWVEKEVKDINETLEDLVHLIRRRFDQYDKHLENQGEINKIVGEKFIEIDKRLEKIETNIIASKGKEHERLKKESFLDNLSTEEV